jgi:hypothetical protein
LVSPMARTAAHEKRKRRDVQAGEDGRGRLSAGDSRGWWSSACAAAATDRQFNSIAAKQRLTASLVGACP